MGKSDYSELSFEEQSIKKANESSGNLPIEKTETDKVVLFLREKKILSSDAEHWKVEFDDGRVFDIVELMHEFVSLK